MHATDTPSPALETLWHACWNQLAVGTGANRGPQPPPPEVLQTLAAAYGEPQRHYHTLQHLEHCLHEFEGIRSRCERPAEVGIALFFHDAVYDPTDLTPGGNETASANWAKRVLAEAGCDAPVVNRVGSLIMATCHGHNESLDGVDIDTVASAADIAWLLDVDLAILGQERSRFARYEEQIKREFAWVPEAAFAQGRLDVLRGFLSQPSIFVTPTFQARYEARAQENLRWAVERLSC